ncbi:Protoheme IX farnesyltransferase [Candidatus Arcanobacter lacustris]|uniref:Protoheme IX farnesyltransferase n=1 Tax=Candidatus Arcanibacter lacustris TaxID=1607817 RepID=A0A0F5MPU2_9RICK|nr:Protoheme IX farnesyltransferase [Candidatus Arcanobacter lacustris]
MAIIATFCIALGAGASGAINMWYETDIDGLMTRTKNRPTVSGAIEPHNALEFGVILAGLSVFIMAFAVNYLAAFLLFLAIIIYVFVYTIWLKRISPQNIVIGGASGALPPMIGWASVTGDVSFESLLLFLLIFFWTPAHFWALALYKSDDYKKANIPMMPLVKGIKHTKLEILIYCAITCILSMIPYFTKMSGLFYGVLAFVANGIFIYLSVRLYKEDGYKIAPKLFGYSILYLFMIFLLLIIDKLYF